MLLKIVPSSLRVVLRRYSRTVDSEEIKQFSQLNPLWWDPSGPTKPLHSLNKLRVPFIRDGLINTGSIGVEKTGKPLPLKGINILDVGCGGGILSQPLARLGANVTGIDANQEIISLAQGKATEQNLRINFEFSCIEDHSSQNKQKYDALVASEILEHVTNKTEFLKACLECLKPNGSIFITTINKTFIANFAGILLAENVFQFLPKGTHDFNKFIEPHRLQRLLEDENCRTELIHGMCYNVFTNNWSWSEDTSINYSLHGVKNEC